jgi:hypothetical protein
VRVARWYQGCLEGHMDWMQLVVFALFVFALLAPGPTLTDRR